MFLREKIFLYAAYGDVKDLSNKLLEKVADS